MVISELPCGSQPTRWRFLQRNRLIAATSLATIVIEAGWRSGSLNTAHHALDMSRPVGAVPGPVTSAASAGCHKLIREGQVMCVTNADEMAELAPPVALAPRVTQGDLAEQIDLADQKVDTTGSRSPEARKNSDQRRRPREDLRLSPRCHHFDDGWGSAPSEAVALHGTGSF